jgi:hypothetical protein
MTDETNIPTRQAVAAQDRSAPMKVTGRLRAALLEMVWKGARRAEAAEAAGMTDHSLRAALKKSHVLAFLRAELGALRESERPRTLNRLAELRDQDENKNAAVAAAKALEAIPDVLPPAFGDPRQVPGIVIRIVSPPAAQPPMVDVSPSRLEDKPSR